MSGISSSGNGINVDIDFGGKIYTMSAMTIGIYKKIAGKLQSDKLSFVSGLINAIPKDIPGYQDMIRGIIKTDGRKVTDVEIRDYLGTTDGGMYAMWLCFSINHPYFTFDDFMRLLTPENMDKIKIAQLSASGEALVSGSPAGNAEAADTTGNAGAGVIPA